MVAGCVALHTNLTYCAATPMQAGMEAALRAEDGSFDGVRELFAGNFDLLGGALRTRGLNVWNADGGYFLVADTGGEKDIEWVRRTHAETGVVCTPMSVFYGEREGVECTQVRLTICKSREHILRACEALGRDSHRAR